MKKILLLLVAVTISVVAWAQDANNFFVSRYGNNTFTVVRNSTDKAETVRYRTVSLSAIAGVHFTPAEGVLQFAEGEKSKSITVEEFDITTVPLFCRYQYSIRRDYRFEVLDLGGFRLAYRDRDITYGDQYNVAGNHINPNIEDLVYIRHIPNSDHETEIMSGLSSDKYVDVSIREDYAIVEDGHDYCYGFSGYTASLWNEEYTSRDGVRQYFSEIGTKLYATVYFKEAEEVDGYQYIQILTDNSETYDGKDPDGKVNTPSISVYKACFELNTRGTVDYDRYLHQFFPHRYDYKNQSAGNQDNTHTEFPREYSTLHQQKFRDNSLRASDAGALVLDPMVQKITVRFDANGSGEDTWRAKQIYVRLALCDKEPPRLVKAYVVNGSFAKGTDFAVTLVFSESVRAQNVVLHTNWGELTSTQPQYSFTNSVTFTGNVSPNVAQGTQLIIQGYEGEITDMMRNPLYNSVSQTFPYCTVSQSYNYPITYDLDGGTATIPNPSYYNYETNDFTLHNPTHPTLYFAGWTGSNGDTPQRVVTIPHGSHGDLHFVANWIPTPYYDINLPENPYGTIVCDRDTAAAGETVTLTIIPNENYDLHSLAVTSGETTIETVAGADGTFTFVMPEGAVTATATFGLIINSNTFPDDNFRDYLITQSCGRDSLITDFEIQWLTELYVQYKNISSLQGIEYFTALRRLYCNNNNLTELNVSQNTALDRIDCYSNQLTELDLSNNTALEILQCSGNLITELDLSQNSALKTLNCSTNQLVSLNVSGCASLENFICRGNPLTELDVSNLPALKYLYCDENQLTTINVTDCGSLSRFECTGNQLASLTVNGCDNLFIFKCFNNKIKAREMEILVGSLPTREEYGYFQVVDINSDPIIEENVITTTQVATATAKGWSVLDSWSNPYNGTEPLVVPGDVDGDGYVTTVDITAIYNYLLNGDETYLSTSDVDGDGFITTTDITVIYNILLGN